MREIKRRVKGRGAVDGAGVKLVRVFGNADVKDFDPFLLLDAFDSTDPADYVKGFPWHPHRGIETLTYLVAGKIEHGDSLGNRGVIEDGSCQWMTAGRGIIHQEMPKAAERMLGFQLWLNLPRKDKMVPPAYRDLRGQGIPRVEQGGARVSIIAGAYGGTVSEFLGDHVKALFLDVELEAGARWELKVDPEATTFAYIMEGDGTFGEAALGEDSAATEAVREALLFGAGDKVAARAGPHGLRFVLLSGLPLREPIAWGGPIVMNSQEELELAFEQLEKGSFLDSKKD